MPPPSTLDPDQDLPVPGRRPPGNADGHGIGGLGPSDSSDSGSDVASGGAVSDERLASDTDAAGTGEDSAADGDIRPDADNGFDRIVGSDEAGVGHGLDEAELAERDPVKPGNTPAIPG